MPLFITWIPLILLKEARRRLWVGANFLTKCALFLLVLLIKGWPCPFFEAEKLLKQDFLEAVWFCNPKSLCRIKKKLFCFVQMFPNFNFGYTMKFYKFSGNAMFNLIDALGLIAYASPVFLFSWKFLRVFNFQKW